MAILGPDGRPFVKPSPGLQGEGTASGGARSVSSPVDLDGLSPRAIRGMLLAAESGDLSQQAALFERMEEKDGELDAHLRTRKSAVASLPWEIRPADDTPQAQKAAAFAEETIRRIPGLTQAIKDLLDAVSKGFSAIEIDWETTGGAWRPARLLYRPQRWFGCDKDDGQTIRLREPWGAAGEELEPAKWLVHRCQARSGFVGRTSLLRSCVRAFIVRHYGWKDWMAFAEVYGMPLRIGHLREGVDWESKEATELWAAVRALGIDAAAVVREGNKIETVETKGARGDIFERIIERAAHEMVLAILGQTLTSGGEKGGSYALGQVHNLVRQDLRDDDAASLSQTLRDQLIAPIVLLNQGQVPIPTWAFLADDPVDLSGLATTLKTLGEASPKFRVIRGWMYQKFGIPEPGPEDETVELGPAPAPGLGMMSNAAELRPVALPALRLHQAEPAAVRRELAERWFAERRVASQAAFESLSAAGKQRVWYAKGLVLENTARMGAIMQEALRDGRTLNWVLDRMEFQKIAVPGAQEAAEGQLANWHARLLYEQNMAAANGAQSWITAWDARAVRPYAQYHSMNDARPTHLALNGIIKPLDDPFWDQFTPPWDYGCRCWMDTLSLADMQSAGLVPTAGKPSVPANPAWSFENRDAYYLSSRGEGPATEAGQRDATVLAGLSLPGELIGA